MSAVADKLREARAYLVTHGWLKGNYGYDGATCMGGACNAVTSGAVFDCSYDPIANEMRELLSRATRTKYVADFNDAPERTQAEVLAAFDRAIELAECGETL